MKYSRLRGGCSGVIGSVDSYVDEVELFYFIYFKFMQLIELRGRTLIFTF